MDSQEESVPKKRKGPLPRPPAAQVKLSMHPDLLDPLDSWIADHPDPKMNRQKAIFHLIRIGLGLSDGKSRVGPLSKRTRK